MTFYKIISNGDGNYQVSQFNIPYSSTVNDVWHLTNSKVRFKNCSTFSKDKAQKISSKTYERTPDKKALSLYKSKQQSKKRVLDYAIANDFNYFVTLTVNCNKFDRFDYENTTKKIIRMIRNFRNRYDENLKYLIIPELHKNGGIHFHGYFYIENLSFLSHFKDNIYNHNFFEKNLGFNTFIFIPKEDKLKTAFYTTKYITKAYKLLNCYYFASRGLFSRNSATILGDTLNFDFNFKNLGLSPDFENQFVKVWNCNLDDFDFFDFEEFQNLSITKKK